MDKKNVMVFGTFDIFHLGHINFLKQAKKYGEVLIAVIARDETVKKVKGSYPQNDERHRLKCVNNSGLADLVVLGDLKDKYKRIRKYEPKVICLGYDQIFFIDKLRQELNEMCLSETRIIKLKPYKPKIYKSSILKNKK